jgi:hypothetical protein
MLLTTFFRRFSLAEGEGFGHRFSPAGSTVDPGSAPSRLRHSNPSEILSRFVVISKQQ